MPKIYFLDVTNRDGIQSSRIIMSKLQRTMLNMYLGRLGIHQSEFGFPFSRIERNYIEANLELGAMGAMGNLVLEGWCRAIVQDVDAALPTGVKHLNLSISTSDQMIINKFMGRLDRDKVIEEMTEAVRRAREGGIETIGVNAEDASRTDMDYLVRYVRAAKDAGANRFRYCDTLGYETPRHFYQRMRTIAEETGMDVEVHCHNDLGLCEANSIAGAQGALDGGVDCYINTCINGIGERAGQADLLSCILAAKYGADMENYEVADPIDLTVAYRLGTYIANAFRMPVPINQVGIGANAFAHESGIHADGALKDRHNYELYDFETLGRGEDERIPTGRVITTGEFGGLAGFLHVYKELGIEFRDREHAAAVLELVQLANTHNQMPLTGDELRFIYQYPDQIAKLMAMAPVGLKERLAAARS